MDGGSVLVVDDDRPHLRALARALAPVAERHIATSGAEALRILAGGAVGLVVSDYRMPEMNGVDLMREVRSRHPDIVLVLLTGYADVAVLSEAINEVGIYHYVEKPWRVADLQQIVRRGLQHRVAEWRRAQLVSELREANEKVTQEAEYKSRLLRLLAHELGTPTHIIVNALGLMPADDSLDEVSLRWIAAMRRAGDWLVRGVGQMQRASCVGSGRLDLVRRRCDLTGLARRAVADLRVAARSRRLVVRESLSEGVAVVGDTEWLHLAIWNLLTNATRSTPDGGELRIETEIAQDQAILRVIDTGVGISPDALTRVFAPFATASGDPVLHGSGWLDFGARGLGLGLYLCRQVAEAHGGGLSAESLPGVGTTFRLSMPLVEAVRQSGDRRTAG